MPAVRAPTASSAKPGSRQNTRTAIATSWPDALDPRREPDSSGVFARERDVAHGAAALRPPARKSIPFVSLPFGKRARWNSISSARSSSGARAGRADAGAVSKRIRSHAVSSTRWIAKTSRSNSSRSAQPLLPGGRQRVVARAAVVLRRAPLRLDPAVQQQPLQRGVERALADLQHFLRQHLEPLRDAVAVQRPRPACAESAGRACPAADQAVDSSLPISLPSLDDGKDGSISGAEVKPPRLSRGSCRGVAVRAVAANPRTREPRTREPRTRDLARPPSQGVNGFDHRHQSHRTD